MATYRLKVWTGPALAVALGRRLRRAGLQVPSTGTEHLYVDVKAQDCAGAVHNLRAQLRRKYQNDFGLRAETCSLRKKRRK